MSTVLLESLDLGAAVRRPTAPRRAPRFATRGAGSDRSHDAFGVFCAMFRELAWQTPIFPWRAAPKAPTASCPPQGGNLSLGTYLFVASGRRGTASVTVDNSGSAGAVVADRVVLEPRAQQARRAHTSERPMHLKGAE